MPLPDFSRQQWVSTEARSVWEPRIDKIGHCFVAAERASVGSIRFAALQGIVPEQFPELAQRAVKIGLIATPVGFQKHVIGYAASSVNPMSSEPWEYRVAFTMPDKAKHFLRAWKEHDNEVIGQLLGYPKCCCKFFERTWASGLIDPTWQMEDQDMAHLDPMKRLVPNILLRWLGVRYVPHLPCGFCCKETIEFGQKLRALIPEDERKWMDELLSMPMLWSSLNGIGEVVTPIVTLNFRTDINHELREIRRLGTSYPEHGAYGLRFPYRLPPGRQVLDVHDDIGHADVNTVEDRLDEQLWTDNGFTSLKAMNASHEMILSTMGTRTGHVIDLGAGNGELLRKIGRGVGVELDSYRADRRVWPFVTQGRIQDVEKLFPGQQFATAMISARRFEELSEEHNKKLREWLKRRVSQVLIYQYENPQFARLEDTS